MARTGVGRGGSDQRARDDGTDFLGRGQGARGVSASRGGGRGEPPPLSHEAAPDAGSSDVPRDVSRKTTALSATAPVESWTATGGDRSLPGPDECMDRARVGYDQKIYPLAD